jgi:hypothetical protein
LADACENNVISAEQELTFSTVEAQLLNGSKFLGFLEQRKEDPTKKRTGQAAILAVVPEAAR